MLSTSRFLAALAFATLAVPACGGGTSADAAVDTVAPSDAADGGLDASDVSDASDVFDANDANDAADVIDDASDAATASFIGMVSVAQLSAACMPVVPPDPLTFMGGISIQNTGTVPIGPVTASDAAIVMGTTVLATFSISPVTIPTVAPGSMGSANTSNVNGTLMPSNICTTPPCGSTVRVRVAISGPNVPAGAFVYSELVPMGCVF